MNDTIRLYHGTDMPLVGFGLYRIDDQRTMDETIRCAYDSGYRLFDTAQMYGNEALLGNALRHCGIPRDEVFLTTKIDPRNMAPHALRESLLDSLHRLQIGLCNAVAHHLDWLADAPAKPAVNQIEVNLHNVQARLCRLCAERGIQVQAWAPLGRGDFSDPYVQQLAAKYGCTPAQIVLQWHLQQGIAVIPKSSHPERIRSNIDLGHLVLDPEEIRRLNARDEYKDTSHNPYTYDYEKAGD